MRALTNVLLYLFALMISHSCLAQQGFSNRSSFGGQFHYGSFITSEPKAVYVRDSYSYFSELFFQQVAPNASRYNRPPTQWGAGVFLGHTGSRRYIGKMAGAFSFIKLPLLKYRKLNSSIRLGAGAAWVQKPYNVVSNHKNVIIGTAFNGYINALWQNEIPVSKKLFLNAGLSFSHLSNGSSTLPNLGLNIPAFSIGLHYSANLQEPLIFQQPNTSLNDWSMGAYSTIGVKQVPWIGSKRYIVNTASVEATKQVSFRSSIGGGAILFYDRTFELDQNDIYPLKRDVSNAQAGVYALYEFKAGRVALPIQVGIPLLNREANDQVFQQVGIRYNVIKNLSGQILLKTYGGRADLIHVGLGYKIF
jgi:hypothetical protein